MPDPIPTDPRKPKNAYGQCDEGYYLHEDGWCYPAQIEPVEPCPRGQHRDENGVCVPDQE